MRKFDMVTAKGYMHDLAVDSAWLTDYAQGKAEGQRLIDMTVTMNRARWLIAELLTEVEAEQTEPQTCDDCIWNVCNYNKAFEDEPQTE